MKDLISIVIPAHNEEEALGYDIDLIRETMQDAKIGYELIVIDDGSKDKTAEIAEQKGVILIKHKT
ncbi:MAG: glycosyltransferase, partial [Elusimicrobiota bacterium]|nr:glycosyltransferase [Elusimicrobiota bacterium]